ncbi:DNA/RNA non-specific endonuclease [Phenylobacterium sp.]|uniref:DNA/RNA non-specific endonuclease n=1 Tax=Phenylobacterium sp. TaxID=1871053 RepID=UPI0027365425|nr:DNA/RNA non-specific endonuclease [Phenylobacterium sp.]MDP3852626.1 DNA/RNA non-specific endonuclease [Phenylobacterium sp.]
MDLQSTGIERWMEAAPAAASFAAVGGPPMARRFKFLTADGQRATPLEQEALLGTNDLVEASFLARCATVIGCIGRVRFHTAKGRGYATGFLIAPGLMMTNHHVFGDESAAQGASLEFGYQYDIAGQIPPTEEYDIQPGVFFAADKDLDFAVVAVAPSSTTGTRLDRRGYLRLNPESGKAAKGDFVTIIQHPDGEPLRIALRENEVLNLLQDPPVIWYRADTAHGSSGAPVFNDSFQIAALHSSGRIKRNEAGEFLRTNGEWVADLGGLGEGDVVWEANVGIRISSICAELLRQAKARSPAHCATLEKAMQGGDVLAAAIDRIKSHAAEGEAKRGDEGMGQSDGRGAPSVSRGSDLVIPLQLRISLEIGGAVAAPATTVSAPQGLVNDLEVEAIKMRIPVVHDGLSQRKGFNRKFLDLAGGKSAPAPALTAVGEALVAPLLDGSGMEVKYHKFSIWMHKERRLALLTAANVDWRARKAVVDGQKTNRKTLAGFPPTGVFAEQWVTDARIAAGHQLPDIFYTEDNQAFDKGHIVRRDDVAWGNTFLDIQKGNGDTYHVTNCSPQTSVFNQGDDGVDNWGDLESHVQKAAKTDQEKVVIYAGPIFTPTDRWFRGKDDSGPLRVQIPNRFWKVVVSKGEAGVEAYGFVIEQDVRAITETEFFVTENWIGEMKRISEIEDALRGWVSLEALKPHDQFDKVQAQA